MAEADEGEHAVVVGGPEHGPAARLAARPGPSPSVASSRIPHQMLPSPMAVAIGEHVLDRRGAVFDPPGAGAVPRQHGHDERRLVEHPGPLVHGLEAAAGLGVAYEDEVPRARVVAARRGEGGFDERLLVVGRDVLGGEVADAPAREQRVEGVHEAPFM